MEVVGWGVQVVSWAVDVMGWGMEVMGLSKGNGEDLGCSSTMRTWVAGVRNST